MTEEKKEKKDMKGFIKTIIFIVVVVSIIRIFFVQAFNIPSGSMKPTLLVGDFILVNKLVYGSWDFGIPFTNITFFHYNNRMAKIDRGDVVVFKYPENPKIDFIKRVIGIPGDIVEVKDDIVYLNGKPLKKEKDGFYKENGLELAPIFYETTYRSDGKPFKYMTMELDIGKGKDFGPVKIPEGHYFMMGDNRDNSRDSRFWGFVPEDYIIGQAFVIYFSVDWKTPMIRFNRLGKVIQ